MPSKWQLMAARKKHESVDPICHLCGEVIDTSLDRYHPKAFELDHIKQKSQGGEDEEWNTLPSHRKCNNRKNNDILAAKRNGNALMAGVKQSREW